MSMLYIEPFSGASGDMFLGALCGLADNYELIGQLPDQLNLRDARVEIREVNKNGIHCNHVKVVDKGLSGHKHPHRHLKEIFQIIENGSISEESKNIARNIFQIIGEAESRIHQVPLEKIHFHELSGVDSIIDIVGSSVLIDLLKIQKTYSDPICTGFGRVKTQHGILPVPAPATADILQGMPVFKGKDEGERTTPTGAAILKHLNPDFTVPVLKSTKISYGPGEKDFKEPNVLKISLIEKSEIEDSDQMYMIDSNIDDTSAEYLGNDFQNGLLESGARDFFLTPVQMKKGRPGLKVSVLTTRDNLAKVCEFILENTSSIGVRYHPVSRQILARRNFEFETKYGKVMVKEVTKPSGEKRFKIEFESLQGLSKKHNISIEKLNAELTSLISSQSGF